MKVSALYLFPVKSLAPIAVESFRCAAAGPLFDREWMVVDGQTNGFLTQRELPRMALVQPSLNQDLGTLMFSAPGMSEPLRISLSLPDQVPRKARVWGDEVDVFDMGSDCALWLSRFLGRDIRLVRALAGTREKHGEDARSLRLVDSFPLHLASQSSLHDLNKKLASPIEMLRFRPNIVLEGSEPWAEDQWSSITIGPSTFRVGRACTRCAITTVNPHTGEKGQEPLKTLSGFRRNKQNNKIEFGLYLHTVENAEIRVGMSASVS